MGIPVKLFDSILSWPKVWAKAFWLILLSVPSKGAIGDREHQARVNYLSFSLPAFLRGDSTAIVIEEPTSKLLSIISRAGRLDRSPKSTGSWVITPLPSGSYKPKISIPVVVDVGKINLGGLRPSGV